jgi:small subunit ribosomal protein S18
MAYGKDKDGDDFKGRRDSGPSGPKQKVAKLSASGKIFVDYKENETLRRVCSANGKIGSRKRSGANALEQRMIAQAIKRARYMALMPYQTTAG